MGFPSRWPTHQLGIQIITPAYSAPTSPRSLTARSTPKWPWLESQLRGCPGEFSRRSSGTNGANPTPVAYAEVYIGVLRSVTDGQGPNPLVASKPKF